MKDCLLSFLIKYVGTSDETMKQTEGGTSVTAIYGILFCRTLETLSTEIWMSHEWREKITDSYIRVVLFYIECLTAVDSVYILRSSFPTFAGDLLLTTSGTQNLNKYLWYDMTYVNPVNVIENYTT